MADFPKKQQQCLIPKYLLDYTTELNKNHPDPSDPWGGGGTPIEAGTGIEITGEDTKTISIDDTVVATKDELNDYELKADAFSGDYNDLTNKPTIPDAVSGTNDGTNWTSLTIGSDTYDIPQGGGSTYTAGTGIDITNDVISVDNTVALKTDIPTNYVTTNTDQSWISGEKTFRGDRRIKFQQSLTSDKLGFTGYDTSGNEIGNLQQQKLSLKTYGKGNWDKWLTSLGDYATDRDSLVGFRTRTTSGTNQQINFIAPHMTYSEFDSVYGLQYDTYFLPIAITDGVGKVFANNKGLINIGGFGYIKSINSSDVTTALGYTPYDSSNPEGYITGINSSDVITALGYTPGTSNFSGDYDDLTNKPTIPTATSQLTNDSGFITSSDLPTNYVTTDTSQTITGWKTFTGLNTFNSSVRFKEHPLIDNSNGTAELDFATYSGGYYEKKGSVSLEPNLSNDGNLTLGVINRTGETYTLRPGLKETNTNNNYEYSTLMPLGSNKYTTFGTGDMNMVLGVNGQVADATGNVSLTIPTTTSQLTNNSGFITNTVNNLTNYTLSSNLATVATSGSYNDLSNKPTIPTVNDNTITITQGGVTKGSFTLNQNTNQTIDVDDVPGMIGEVLYDVPNGEAGVNPITMAHSFADYSYVDIQYRCFDNAYEVRSQRIYDPNGKHVYLDWDVLVSGAVYAKKSIYILSGNTMTVRDGSDMQVWYSNGSNVSTQVTPTTDYQHQIKITKVIGYKTNNSAMTTEQWTFTLQDNTTVTKNIVVF